jgi:6-phosphogluconolactonase (cycloisomerase 2 family)
MVESRCPAAPQPVQFLPSSKIEWRNGFSRWRAGTPELVNALRSTGGKMTHRAVLLVVLLAAVAALTASQTVGADEGNTGRVVFVQTNEPSGNRVVVYNVTAGGTLARAGSYPTGGNGGVAAPGTESDHLASQGSLVYDAQHQLLIAVNAGSDSVSTFSVSGDRLRLEGVVPSGGQFPASTSVHDSLVYVLNAGGSGIVKGFRIVNRKLVAISESARSLGLANTDPSNFLTSPGEVGFTPSGRQLIVTTKASGSMIDVFQVGGDGRLSLTPVKNPSATPVPFAFTFTSTGRLAVGEAAMSEVTTYVLRPDGTLAEPKSQSDNQVALCWILRVGRFFYVSNTGSNSLSGFEISAAGQPSLVGPTGVVATTEPGPIDLTSPTGTNFLYAQTGGGRVNEFRVNSNGSLTKLGVIGDLPPGMEGIAST